MTAFSDSVYTPVQATTPAAYYSVSKNELFMNMHAWLYMAKMY